MKIGEMMLLKGNNKTYTFLAIILVLLMILYLPEASISADKTTGKETVAAKEAQKNNSYANAQISIKIIPSVNKTFGYDIFLDGKLLVHQPNIPALSGNEGFITKERAKKVAAFVVDKIRRNEMPPMVTTDDLDNMGVLK
ncbi:MAG: DUF4907 domain-containing protein [Thermodesulfobacteriota bacterium]|nr:DUF4907 domain-containing protein [Thermodesulfobacteriota bacterium]